MKISHFYYLFERRNEKEWSFFISQMYKIEGNVGCIYLFVLLFLKIKYIYNIKIINAFMSRKNNTIEILIFPVKIYFSVSIFLYNLFIYFHLFFNSSKQTYFFLLFF